MFVYNTAPFKYEIVIGSFSVYSKQKHKSHFRMIILL